MFCFTSRGNLHLDKWPVRPATSSSSSPFSRCSSSLLLVFPGNPSRAAFRDATAMRTCFTRFPPPSFFSRTFLFFFGKRSGSNSGEVALKTGLPSPFFFFSHFSPFSALSTMIEDIHTTRKGEAHLLCAAGLRCFSLFSSFATLFFLSPPPLGGNP